MQMDTIDDNLIIRTDYYVLVVDDMEKVSCVIQHHKKIL